MWMRGRMGRSLLVWPRKSSRLVEKVIARVEAITSQILDSLAADPCLASSSEAMTMASVLPTHE